MSKLFLSSILFLATMVALISSSWALSLPSDGFNEYAYQTCITYCYSNFRPTRFPTDHTNCVQRCQRQYNKGQYDLFLPPKRDSDFGVRSR